MEGSRLLGTQHMPSHKILRTKFLLKRVGCNDLGLL